MVFFEGFLKIVRKWDKKSKYVTTCLNKEVMWVKVRGWGFWSWLVTFSWSRRNFLSIIQYFSRFFHLALFSLILITLFEDLGTNFLLRPRGFFLKIYYDFPKARNNTFYQRSRWGFLRSRPWLFSRYHQLFTIAENSFSTFCLHFLIIFHQAPTKLKRKSHDLFFWLTSW